MKISNIVAPGLLAMSLLLAACGGSEGGAASTPSQPKQYDYERADSLDHDYLRGLATIRVNIEETAQMNEAMRISGFSFNGGACNSASRASSYSGSKAQAMNLGVYAADLNYAACFEAANEVRTYMDATMGLADKLGVRAAFDEEIITQIVEGDSATNRSVLLSEAYLNAEDQLYSEDRAELATYMIVGGWAEGMWIAADAINSKPGGSDFWKGLFAHAYTFVKVREMVQMFADRGSSDFVELGKQLDAAAPAINKLINTKGERPTRGTIDEVHAAMKTLRGQITG